MKNVLMPDYEMKLARYYYDELAELGLTRASKGVPKQTLQEAMVRASRKVIEETYK